MPWRWLQEQGGIQGLALLPGPAGTPAKSAEIKRITEVFGDLDGRIPGFVMAAALAQPPVADVDIAHDAIEQAVRSREMVRSVPPLYDPVFAKPPRNCQSDDLLLCDLADIRWSFKARIARETQAAILGLPNPWYFFKEATVIDAIRDGILEPADLLERYQGGKRKRLISLAKKTIETMDPTNPKDLAIASLVGDGGSSERG